MNKNNNYDMFIEKFNLLNLIKGMFLTAFCYCCVNFSATIATALDIPFINKNLNFIVYLILFSVTIALFYKEIKNGINTLSEEKIKTMLVVCIITLISIIMPSIINTFFNDMINPNQEKIEQAVKTSKLLLSISAVLFAPLVEEFVFRFFIFRCIGKINFILAHIMVAILFSIYHIFSANMVINFQLVLLLLPYIAMSIGLTIVYYKTKSIIYPIIMHMIVNLIANL